MKKILNVMMFGFILTGFSSCLKSTNLIGPDAPGAIKNVVEFQNVNTISSPTSSTYPLYIQSFDAGPTGVLTLQVNYAGADVAPQDIAVKVVLDPTAISTYNTENATSYTPLTTSLYTLSSLDLVIPKGQRTADISITVKPDDFDFSKAYALAFKITSASTGVISGNFGTVVLALGAKNRYDGVYGYKSGPNQSLNPNADQQGAKLVTAQANTVTTMLVNTYSNVVTYSIDPVTNKATVLNSGGIGAATTDPISNWDPAKKILHIKWKTSNRTFDETYTYTGKR